MSSVTKFYGVKVICLPAKCTTLPGLPSAMVPTPFSRTLASSRSSLELANERCGIYDRKISIVLKDDKYEPDGAVQNTNELIEKEKSLFLFDYVGTPTLTRVLPLLKCYEKERS